MPPFTEGLPQVEESTSDYDKEKLQERLAKLVGGMDGMGGGDMY